MYIRTATALVAVGLFSALTTAATASAASASAPAAPTPCAQEHLALMEAEDNLAKVDAVPAVKNAYEAMMKARDAANVDKLSQQMAQHELSANARRWTPPRRRRWTPTTPPGPSTCRCSARNSRRSHRVSRTPGTRSRSASRRSPPEPGPHDMIRSSRDHDRGSVRRGIGGPRQRPGPDRRGPR
ncbi:hypothetical protein ACFQX6_15775 [Streptosporangium lutulentum]